MKTTRVPAHICTCGSVNDAASSREYVPEAGSISICVECGVLTVFNEDLTLRPPTAEELADIQADPIWQQIVAIQDSIVLRGRSRTQ